MTHVVMVSQKHIQGIFAFLGLYAAWIGGLLRTFRQNLSVSPIRPKHDKRTAGILKTGRINVPKRL